MPNPKFVNHPINDQVFEGKYVQLLAKIKHQKLNLKVELETKKKKSQADRDLSILVIFFVNTVIAQSPLLSCSITSALSLSFCREGEQEEKPETKAITSARIQSGMREIYAYRSRLSKPTLSLSNNIMDFVVLLDSNWVSSLKTWNPVTWNLLNKNILDANLKPDPIRK